MRFEAALLADRAAVPGHNEPALCHARPRTMSSLLLFVLTYLIAREAVRGWRELGILLALTGTMIAIANLTGYEQSTHLGGAQIGFRPTTFDNATVLLSAVLMLLARTLRRA